MLSNQLQITICPLQFSSEATLQFMDILVDETLLYGTVYIPSACFQTVSTLNHRLPSKQVYELVLRLSLQYPVLLKENSPADTSDDYVILTCEAAALDINSIKSDCYIISRYKSSLQEHALFDAAVTSVLACAKEIQKESYVVSFLSDMLSENTSYRSLYAGSQPFLIYIGDDVCYNILSVFAKEFGMALRRLGYLVEYFDLSKEDFTETYRLIGKSYQAVIGVQSYMFSAKLTHNRGFLHDKIYGPKYNFMLDHPSRVENHLKETPSALSLLTVDKNYAIYAQKTYSVNAIFFPPGGICTDFLPQERIYDVTFIGSYFDNFSFVMERFAEFDRKQRFLANRFWLILKKNPRLTAEDALTQALDYYHISLPWSDFAKLFHTFRDLVVYIATYYRVKVLKSFINAGIPVHVFGTSWKSCPLRTHSNFIWHNTDLSTDECLHIWQQTKIALNTMTWHKCGITERILNSMLQKAVVLTERNPYMESAFSDGNDILFYDLDNLNELPALVQHILSNPKQLSAIAENGYGNALANHTWDARAKAFLDIIS